MARPEILRYMRMDQEGLKAVLGLEPPPMDALRAAAILEFMNAYHLTDPEDGLGQYLKLREAQADLLGLGSEERREFLDGFGEKPVAC